MQTTSVAKDFHRLMKRVGRLTDGQASIGDVDWDEGSLYKFELAIRPNSGYYKGGKFIFTIHLPDDFPSDRPPVVWCETEIYHPNIDTTETNFNDEADTNVCLNLLDHGTWRPSYGLEGLILGLVFLMHHPNTGEPLSPYFDGYIDEEDFAANVKKYMAGEEVDGETFDIDFCVKEASENSVNETNTSNENKANEKERDSAGNVTNASNGSEEIPANPDEETATKETSDLNEDTDNENDSNFKQSTEQNATLDNPTDNITDANVKLEMCKDHQEMKINENPLVANVTVGDTSDKAVSSKDAKLEQEVTEKTSEMPTECKKDTYCVHPEVKYSTADKAEVSSGTAYGTEAVAEITCDIDCDRDNKQDIKEHLEERMDMVHALLDEMIKGTVECELDNDTEDVRVVVIDGECMLLTERVYESETNDDNEGKTETPNDNDEMTEVKADENDLEDLCNVDTDQQEIIENKPTDPNTTAIGGHPNIVQASDVYESCRKDVDDIEDDGGAMCNQEQCDINGAAKLLKFLFRLVVIPLKLHYESTL